MWPKQRSKVRVLQPCEEKEESFTTFVVPQESVLGKPKTKPNYLQASIMAVLGALVMLNQRA